MTSISRAFVRSLVAAAAAVAALAGARSASACFDGYVATVGEVQVQSAFDGASWSPDDARHVARWGARINAILPAGAHLDVFGGDASCSNACGGVSTLAAGADDLPRLFREAAAAFRAPAASQRAAGALDPKLYTVQLFAGSARRAAAVKARVAALGAGEHGFFEEGGFPASNDTAHVIRDAGAGALHRVVVGVFLSQRAADAARAALLAQGLAGFTRELPAGLPVGERQFSRGG